MAPRTRGVAKLDYGRFLLWLRNHGRLTPCANPADRVQPEMVKGFVQSELARGLRFSTMSTVLFNLLVMFESFDPQRDWGWLRVLRARIKRRASRERRTKPHIVPAQDVRDLAVELMGDACDPQRHYVVDHDRYLDGILIALLIALHPRIKNFAALELDRHLVRGPDQWQFHLPGEVTKNGQPDNGLLPASFTPWVDAYVELVRAPFLSQHRGNTLTTRFWIGLDGRPLSGHLIRERIKRRTRQAFGFSICPHTFRRIAATTFILERPEYALHAPALLGHRSENTVQRHYFSAQRQLAIETYHELRRLRRTGQSPACQRGTLIERRIRALSLCAPPVKAW